MTFEPITFERASRIYPQPIALSCGRVVRARVPQDRLVNIVKCAEVLTRYLSALALASFAAREDRDASLSSSLRSQLSGAISWGTFLESVQFAAGTSCEHPLKGMLAKGFKRKGENRGEADQALTDTLVLRNLTSHTLQGVTAPEAEALLEDAQPERQLLLALNAVFPVLSLPLFLFEEQQMKAKQLVARRLLLMGESADPKPEELPITEALMHNTTPYVAVRGGALCLRPWLLWRYNAGAGNFGVYFLDEIEDAELEYQSLRRDYVHLGEPLCEEVAAVIDGETVPVEPIALEGGESLTTEWRRIRAERDLQRIEVPWDSMAAETLAWYAGRLQDGAPDPRAIITERLLDGRSQLPPEDVRQLVLLFGTKEAVRQTAHRDVLDLRQRAGTNPRWDSRVEVRENIFRCLEHVMHFLCEYLHIEDAQLDRLHEIEGTSDYRATREALINILIHQDYGDLLGAGQIEIAPEHATFFNPGRALVSPARLVEGGVSHARNPLIARAFRLIGFAELAGTGLRAVHHAWREAHRWPPVIESNAETNTFTLVLDWRPLPDTLDTFWQRHLRIDLTPEQSLTLSLAADPSGTSVEQVASAADLTVPAAREAVERLAGRALVRESRGRIYLQEGLRQYADEAARIEWLQEQLMTQPSSFENLLPRFEGETHGHLTRDEARTNLKRLLEENFLQYSGVGRAPHQVARALAEGSVRYEAGDPPLWYAADRRSEQDREKLHESELLREFERYATAPGRSMISLGALRAGFERAWQERDYATIAQVGTHVPEELLQRDEKVLRWFDQAQIRARGR